jgi:hypothetical protein
LHSLPLKATNQQFSKLDRMDLEFLLLKLKDAFNTHDIESLNECFDEGYYSEQPVHPDRTFQGQEQVKKNWVSNFNEMPDFSAQLLRHAISDTSIWAEWEWQGTRSDKSRLLMRGVTIMGVEGGKIKWGRLYIEPVDVNGKGIEAAVKEVMHGKKID